MNQPSSTRPDLGPSPVALGLTGVVLCGWVVATVYAEPLAAVLRDAVDHVEVAFAWDVLPGPSEESE